MRGGKIPALFSSDYDGHADTISHRINTNPYTNLCTINCTLMLNFISTRGIMSACDDFFNSFISCLQRPAVLITRGVSFSGFVINRWNSFPTMIDRYRETVNPSLERLPRSSGRKILSYFPSKFSTNSSIMSAQA